MKTLTHEKKDTWTTPDGTVYFDQRAAERHVAHMQMAAALLARFGSRNPDEIVPPMTYNAMTELILSLTFDAQPVVDASSTTSGRLTT